MRSCHAEFRHRIPPSHSAPIKTDKRDLGTAGIPKSRRHIS